MEKSDKKKLPALLLGAWLGIFGAHRFYVGKIGTAVLLLILSSVLIIAWFTAIVMSVDFFALFWFIFIALGIVGIFIIVDLIRIISGNFVDSKGQKLEDWL